MLLLLLGCAIEQRSFATDTAEDTDTAADTTCVGVPAISPGALAFGDVDVGALVEQTVTVSNSGCGNLELRGLALEAGEASFSLSSLGSVLLPPGGNTTFTAGFTPLAASAFVDRILLATDVGDLAVDLSGNGVAPALTLSGTCTFDGTPLGCSTGCTIELTNTGGADLTLVGTMLESTTSPAFAHSQAFPDGSTLAPLESTSVRVSFNPMDEAPATGALVVYSDDPVNPEQTFPLSGTAAPAATCP